VGDYAAAPSEPIVQGLITVGGSGPAFLGRGISSIVRTPVGAPLFGSANGDYLLTLDVGLPGDVGLDPPFGRTLLTVRGAFSNAIHFSTTIDQKSVSYVPSAVFGVGSNVVRVVLAVSSTGFATDPTGTDGSGCEIVIWRGAAGGAR
jgi:hypothetical protein